MMLSQQMGAYRTEPKEAAPLLLIIPTSSAALNSTACSKSFLVGSQAVGKDYQQVDCGQHGWSWQFVLLYGGFSFSSSQNKIHVTRPPSLCGSYCILSKPVREANGQSTLGRSRCGGYGEAVYIDQSM